LNYVEIINEYCEKLSKKKGERSILKKQLRELKERKESLLKESKAIDKAKVIAQIVAKKTQKNIEYNISQLVTQGLEAIFPEPYSFKLQFVSRRNRAEVDLVFEKNGREVTNILDSGGGGVADIASYLLTIAVFSIHPTRPLLISDEKFKFLHSPIFQEKASKMIKKISKRFDIQVVLISDQPNLYKYADKVIEVKIKDGVSYV